MTHGKSYVVHLNVWLIISHMIDDAIKDNKGIKKKKIIIIKKKKKDKSHNGKGITEGEVRGEGEKNILFFLFVSFSYL